MNKLTDFARGIIAGFVLSAIVFSLIIAILFVNMRERTYGTKELINYAEKQMEIEALRDDVVNCDPAEFIDAIPDVRRAADGAAAEFERKRDEALQRFRSKRTD
jgi:hypothetical protein